MSTYTTALILPDYASDKEDWIYFNRSRWSSFLTTKGAAFDTINIIVCGNDRRAIFPWTQSSVARDYPTLTTATWKQFYKTHQEIYNWLEMFDEDFTSPQVNFITSQQLPLINQKVVPKLLPEVSQIYYFEKTVRYYPQRNVCFVETDDATYMKLLK